MGSHRQAAAITMVAIACFADSARAQSTTVHATGSFGVAYTDNMLGTASDPAPGEPEPVSVWFLEVAPGAIVFHEARRSIHSVSYQHPFTFYLGHAEANEGSDVGTWRSLFSLSAQDELTLGATVSRATTRVANLLGPPNATGVDATVPGDNTLLQIDVFQGLVHDFSPDWQGNQTSAVGLVVPLDTPGPQPNRWLFQLGAGLDYFQGHNAYGVLGDATYFVTTEVDEGEVHTPREEQVIVTGRGRWRRDLTPTWSSELQLGLASAMPTDLSGGIVALVWLGALRYNFDRYTAEIVGERLVAPSLITAQTFIADQVRVGGAIALSEEAHLDVLSGLGYAHNRIIDVGAGTRIATYDSWFGDAALAWSPEGGPQVALRYQHTRQIGNEDDPVPATTFHRNLVMLTLGYMWPPRDLPRVPTGPTQRVDGGDRDPLAPGNETTTGAEAARAAEQRGGESRGGGR